MPVRFYGWRNDIYRAKIFPGSRLGYPSGTEPDPQLTIAEVIFLGREFVNRFGKIDWKTMYAEADKLLAKLNLRFKSDKLVGDLSIGDQQMVEIAKVLSFESKVIIMDEPTDALTRYRNRIPVPRHPRAGIARPRYCLYLPPHERNLRDLR